MENIKNTIFIGLGGALGSSARYLLSLFIKSFYHGQFPFHTLIINLVGSFIIGFVYGIIKPDNVLWLFLAVGFCGGFTTFSAFSLENIFFLLSKNTIYAILYTSVSVLAGIFAVYVGILLSRAW